MEKQKNGELSRMFGYAGKFHALTVLGCVLSGISTILSMLPFVCIWLVIRDLIQAFAAGDISLATESTHYAWMAVVFAAASILIYFIALNCTHLAAFRTATNMRKSAIHHIVTLPLGYFSQNASGRLRKIIDDNAGLTEGFLAHQLPDLTGAAVMPVAVIILIFLFDWRLGICCLIPMGISVIFLKQMMGGDNAQFMGKYMTALETMNKEAVEYIRGIPVVKVFQQTIYSFKNFHAAIEEYEKFASGYALSDQGAKDLIKGIVYSVLANISLMFPVILLAIVLNQLLAPVLGASAPEISAAVYTVIGIVILAVVFIFHYCQYTAAYLGTYDESARRRIGLAEKLRTLPLTFFHQRDLADLTSTIMGDCANFEHAFSHTVPQFFGAVISTGIVCIGLLIFNWQMGLALLWVAPISFAIVILSRKWQEKLSKKHMNARLELAEGIQECLETVQDIKACNQEEDYLRKLDAKMDAAEKAQISSEMTTASLLTTGQMFLRLGLATVIVVGNSLVVSGDTSLFTYILFLIAASRLYDPLSGAMSNMAELFSVQLQVNRLKEIEEYPEETGEKNIHTNGYDITFDHVQFSYEKGKPVLRDVSFTAKQGQVTALVGPSGGGKSTVAKLAAKFYPLDGGRILLGGTDIAPLNSTMLMKNFSIVFQDVVLFNNTIMENIRVGKKDATDEEVVAAAKAAQCDEFISKLPDGYQTVIGENGSTLSGGECQRLSIARALLKDAPVILLDEATASLDVDNETEIQNAISRLVKGKTVLIIAHRMRTVESADNIVVLSDGIVAENGTHEELMKENGLYRRLVDLQTASANWKLSV